MMFTSSIASYAQTQVYPSVDSSSCYTVPELQIIAGFLLEGAKNDSLNKILTQEVESLKGIITTQDNIIENQKVNISLQELQYSELSAINELVNRQYKQEVKNHNKTKLKFGVVALLTTSISIALLFTR